MSLLDNSRTAERPTDSAAINLLDVIQILRPAGKSLLAQAVLHWRLALIEWAEEKTRLAKMLMFGLLGFACALSVMLLVGALVMASFWDTTYRIPASIAIIAVYSLGIAFAWWRLRVLSAMSAQAFAASREEFAIDIAILRNRL